jgi:aspartate aminotransferase
MSGLIERLDGIHDDIGLAEFLLDKAGVAMVPGSAFGSPGNMRLSFATSLDNLQEAVKRIRDVTGQ